jgi:hypothetical protein
MRSARVDLPWSMWAMMEKLRMLFINTQNQVGKDDAGRIARQVCQRHTKKALRGGHGNPQASALIKREKLFFWHRQDRSFSDPCILPDFRVESPVYPIWRGAQAAR